VFGTIDAMAGTTPACGAEDFGVLYPQPKLRIASNKTAIIFIVFSSREGYRLEMFLTKRKSASVSEVSFSCKEDVDKVSRRQRKQVPPLRSLRSLPSG